MEERIKELIRTYEAVIAGCVADSKATKNALKQVQICNKKHQFQQFVNNLKWALAGDKK